MRAALFWVIRQRVVVISYRRFGTIYLQESRSLTPEHGSSSHLTRCRNLISSNLLNLPWLLCELRYSHRRFRTTYRFHLQGTRILTLEHGSSSHLIRFRNLISRNMLNLPRFLCELMSSHRRFGTTYQAHLIGDRILKSRNMPNLPRFLCELIISHRRFGTTYRSHLIGSRILKSRNMLNLPRFCVNWCAVIDVSGLPIGPI